MYGTSRRRSIGMYAREAGGCAATIEIDKKQKSSGVDTVTMFEMPEKVGTTSKI